MKAYVVTEYIKPSQLKPIKDAPEPVPKANEVLVDVYSGYSQALIEHEFHSDNIMAIEA
jgi:hypothetical protein